MSANIDVKEALVGMGVDGLKATAAASRYNSVESALNWVFGEGESWTPSADMPSMSTWSDSDWDREPSPAPPQQIGSNNPFRESMYGPPPPPPRPTIQSDEEEELRRALELSKQADADERQERERERSVRASAPPPSPGRTDGDEQPFSVSASLEPASTVALNAALRPGKEEEDFQRAIQESMMTASFNSVADVEIVLPPPQPRAPGAPVVLLTAEQPTFAAHIMQALAAVPQLRDVFANIQVEADDPTPLVALHEAFADQAREANNYVVVDECVKTLHAEWDVHSVSLPPHMPIFDKWIPHLHRQLIDASNVRSLVLMDDTLADFYSKPEQLLATRLQSNAHAQLHVAFDRTLSTPTTIHANLAALIWTADNPGETIEQLADVVSVGLRRMPGVAAAKWELDEEVVLDRYLTCNAAWSAQIRARQAVVQGELRRLKENAERLTTYKENSIPDAIQTLIKHLDASPEDSPARADLKAKLERVQDLMTAKVAKLQEAAAENEREASGGLFDTADPSKNQNRYLLRAILWHDGFLTPGRHLYTYIRGEDAWWRIQDEVADKVEWDEIQADTTGQFTDGGPYLLVYSRDGPRPVEERATEHEPMDVDMDNVTTLDGSVGDSATTLDGSVGDIAEPPAIVSKPAPMPAPVLRSRPPSPVKGAVRGPRPLVSKTSFTDIRAGESTVATAAPMPGTEHPHPAGDALTLAAEQISTSPTQPADAVNAPSVQQQTDADVDLIM